jgi:hypothetical protein
MNPWNFIAGAYAVTLLLVVVEIVAVHLRRRAAESLLDAGDEPHPHSADSPGSP